MAFLIRHDNGGYLSRDATNRFTLTPKDRAIRYDTEEKANNVIQNSIMASERDSYSVEKDDEPNVEQARMDRETTKKKLCFRVIEACSVEKYGIDMNMILNAVAGVPERSEELNEKLSGVDKEIVDLEHYIEFTELNAYQGWIAFKMLQNTLRQRRQYKNELEILRSIRESGLCASANTLLKQFEQQQTKHYKARVYPELFRG